MTDKHTQGFKKIKELKSIFGSYLTVAPLSVRVRGKIKGQIKDNTSQDLIISSCKFFKDQNPFFIHPKTAQNAL